MQKITELNDGTDPTNAHTHDYTYFPNGRVFQVEDSEGGIQTFNYNLLRNLTEFTDENGHTETYIHQENGLTSRQIHPDRTRQIFTWGKIDTPAEFLMTSSTDEVGAVEKFTYYTDDASYFEDSSHAHVVPSSDFRLRELQKSTSKHLVDEATGSPLSGQLVVTTEFDYSQPNLRSHMTNLASTRVNPDTDAITTQFQYDVLGRLTKNIDAMGNVTTRSYYANSATYEGGLLQSKTGPRGNDTHVSTAANQEFVRWEELANNFVLTGDTLSVRVTAPNGMVAAGQHVNVDAVRIERIDGDFPYSQIIDEDDDDLNDAFTTTGDAFYRDSGGTSDYSVYMNADRILLTSDGSTATWKFSHLEPGTYRVFATWHPLATRSTAVPYEIFDGTPQSSVSSIAPPPVDQTAHPADDLELFKTVFVYDTAGNVVSTSTDGLPSTTRTYDHHGNVLTSLAPDNVLLRNTYDVLGRQKSAEIIPTDGSPIATSTFAYDSNGRIEFTTDSLGRVTEFEYDSKGNLLKEIYADGTVVTSAYDGLENSNRISQTDQLGRTTRFVYDSRNRLIQTIHPDGTSERIRYNGTGQVTASIDALGNQTTFAYGAAGRLLETKDAADARIRYAYNSLGPDQAKLDQGLENWAKKNSKTIYILCLQITSAYGQHIVHGGFSSECQDTTSVSRTQAED